MAGPQTGSGQPDAGAGGAAAPATYTVDPGSFKDNFQVDSFLYGLFPGVVDAKLATVAKGQGLEAATAAATAHASLEDVRRVMQTLDK